MAISLSGLAMPWLGDNAFLSIPKKQRNAHRPKRSKLAAPMVMADIDRAYGGDGFVSPCDRTLISSRSKLREHNNKHGVRQYGDVPLADHTASMEKHMDAATPSPQEKKGVSFEWTK